MNIQDYQIASTRTLNKELTEREQISNMVIGANGELGEVSDSIKKWLYQGHDIDKEHLEEEIGDTLFYITNLATLFNISMENVLDKNVAKLQKRYKNGFSVEESINREE